MGEGLIVVDIGLPPSAPEGPLDLYWYRADVVAAYDADTVDVDIDLGLHQWRRDLRLRLAGINAWEVRGAEREKGVAARDYLRGRIVGQTVTIKTVRDETGKFGRLLAWIFVGDENLNETLVRLGHARWQSY